MSKPLLPAPVLIGEVTISPKQVVRVQSRYGNEGEAFLEVRLYDRLASHAKVYTPTGRVVLLRLEDILALLIKVSATERLDQGGDK